jgi:hypothetical protein
MVGSELDLFRSVDRFHVTNVSSQELVAVAYDYPARLKDVFPRGEDSAIFCLRLFFSDAWIEGSLLPVLNRKMARLRSQLGPDARSRCSDMTVSTWWSYFITFMLHNLSSAHKLKGEAQEEYVELKKGLGENRYKYCSDAHNIDNAELSALLDSVNVQLLRVFQPGNTICVDEALYAYAGEDMRRDGVSMQIPRKPHSYGLLSYYGTAKLTHSKIPIAFCFEARTYDNTISPDVALTRIIERALLHTNGMIHAIADSGFHARKMLDTFYNYRVRDVRLTISISAATNSGYKPIYDVGSQQLAAEQSRTFWNGSMVVQFAAREDHITAVATTFWRPKTAEYIDAAPATLSYETALTLYQKESIATLVAFGRFPPHTSRESKGAIVKMITGWDVSLPKAGTPLEQQTQPLTKTLLKNMYRWQLDLLLNDTPNSGKVSSKKVDDVIAHILLYRSPRPNRAPAMETPLRPADELIARRSRLLDDRSTAAPVVAFYAQHYNFIDQIDRSYYYTFDPACCKSYQKLFLASGLWLMLRSAWATYEERRRERAVHINKRQKSAGIDDNISSFREYMLNVFRALRDEAAAK